MVALRDLFFATQGASSWLRRDRWLEGEPCVNRWHGLVCCPRSHPYISADLTLCLEAKDNTAGDTLPALPTALDGTSPATGARRLSVTTPTAATRTATANLTVSGPRSTRRGLQVNEVCHSGNSTGVLAFDEATCEVVALMLSDNNLTGHLPLSLFERANLDFLSVLDLRNNRLSGALPSNVSFGFDRIDISNNTFEYPPPPSLLAACLSGQIVCRGYPPESCAAFGERFVPRTDAATQCVECDEAWVSIVLTTVVLFLFFAMLVGYAYFMSRHEGITTQGVSTIAIIITHLQTVFIVSKLRLAWPPSTKALFQWLVIDGLNLEGARPECILQGSEMDAPLFFIFSITRSAPRAPIHPLHSFCPSTLLLLSLSLALPLNHTQLLSHYARLLPHPCAQSRCRS